VIPLSETITITQMHVPVDDTHTYWYSFFTSFAEPLDKEGPCAAAPGRRGAARLRAQEGPPQRLGLRPRRAAHRTYLGMGEDDINVHDQWAVESMGAIQDRTREHLGTSDKVIMANRRTLLQGHRHRAAGGTPPMAADGRRGRGHHRPRHHRLHRAGRRAGAPSGSRRVRPSATARPGCSRPTAEAAGLSA
jgi:phthalate 4,5-dioxygenase oxygenase subunit